MDEPNLFGPTTKDGKRIRDMLFDPVYCHEGGEDLESSVIEFDLAGNGIWTAMFYAPDVIENGDLFVPVAECYSTKDALNALENQ